MQNHLLISQTQNLVLSLTELAPFRQLWAVAVAEVSSGRSLNLSG